MYPVQDQWMILNNLAFVLTLHFSASLMIMFKTEIPAVARLYHILFVPKCLWTLSTSTIECAPNLNAFMLTELKTEKGKKLWKPCVKLVKNLRAIFFWQFDIFVLKKIYYPFICKEVIISLLCLNKLRKFLTVYICRKKVLIVYPPSFQWLLLKQSNISNKVYLIHISKWHIHSLNHSFIDVCYNCCSHLYVL